ncbi:MAG: GAF domain-containing protein, partial [Cyanobacteria bacterium J06576_12]
EPFRSGQQELGVKSTYAIPVLLDGHYWGMIGIDDCHHLTRRSESELEALTTLANCISNAIEKDRSRKEKEAAAKARVAELAERDRILEATAAAANVMLINDNFENAVSEALSIVGEGLSVDRVALMQRFDASAQHELGYFQILHEWTSSDVSLQIEHPKLSIITDDGIEAIVKKLRNGEIFGGIVEELDEPFRSGQLELGVQSTYSIPVRVENYLWGIISIDDCHKQTRRSKAELEALMTLTNCIGSAIEQERNKKARDAAERTAIIERERAARADELEAANKVLSVRDKWLQTTAAAANELLSTTDVPASVNAALATIGENLECDRVSVMQHIVDDNAASDADELGIMRLLYEWDAEGIAAQNDNPNLRDISADGVEDWFRQILAGQSVGGLVEALEEPFRSSMQSLNVKSTYAVPVFVEGKIWGMVHPNHSP